jgi:hypothetical protein
MTYKFLKLIAVFLFLLTFCANAQQSITKYYDADWMASTKDKATYYAEFVKQDTAYKCQSYWMGSDILRAKSTFADTTFAKAIGIQLRYYKNGNVEDSTLYDDNGQIAYTYHYHPNKQLAIYFVPDGKPGATTEAYDESGKKIKNYVYMKEAEFKGGEKAWHSYLLKNITKDFQHTKDNTELTVKVHVQFIVDENGYVTKPTILKSSGLNFVDRDAQRVILSSPVWKNAVLMNKPVKAYRVQPFTYILTPSKKTK